ncbi:MAG: serine hydrolase [Balneolaceae bacterium]
MKYGTGHISNRGFLLLLVIAAVCIQSCSEKYPFSEADNLVETALNDSLFAGAVLLVGSSEEILHQQAFGYADLIDSEMNRISNPEVMTTNHVFDLASLTKVLATTYAVMILHDRGELHVDDPVYHYLPSFGVTDKQAITLRHLLTHTSGLMQWFPTFYVAENAKERLDFISSRALNWPVGEQRRYSDLGFMVLADIVEKVSGQSLDQFLNANLYHPLGLKSTLFNPGSDYPYVVSTSHGNPFEKRMVADDDFGYTIDIDADSWTAWRNYTLKGEVNDGNACYTHQGVAGHAGLFSTAADVYRLLSVLINDGRYNGNQFITRDTIDIFLTKDSNNQGLGWSMDGGFVQAENLSDGSFGHTGFTGTHVVVSPDNDLILILFTNRQHFGVNEGGYYPDLRTLRTRLAALFFQEE